MDRATVAKYADMDDMTPKPPMDRRRGSKIDPYAALVDGWLEADRMLPRKQRHTAKRVHDRLRAETGYDGEYTTTLRYVRRWREANRSGSDGYGELVWAPGVAQIDFGVAKARIAGELVDDHCLVVTFPHSNMRYVTSLPGENAECLCHGLVEVFEHIGGVPPVIVMDNATGAGRRNARGEVTLTAVFDAFLAHHRIDARFCNPYSGWEKGAVENAVGFLRRNLMVPPLEAETHAQLGRIMLDRCDALADIRWDSVRITDPGTGEIVARYPRVYGRSQSTLQDPELAMPVLAAKPGSWRESSIRPDSPEDVRAWLDEADSKRLAQSLRSIGAACAAAGFGNAVAAASRAIVDGPGSALDESTLVTLALRARDADAGAITDDGPDLAGYDRFITGNGGKETER